MSSNQDGYIYVKQIAYGQEDEERHTIRVPVFPEGVTPASVTITGSVTKNLGNYNSARVEASITLPCLPVEEEVGRVATILEGWVDEIIGSKISRIEM